MPELPEVETIRRDLAAHLGATRPRIARVRTSAAPLRQPPHAALAPAAAEGARIDAVDRHGKLLLVRLSHPDGPRTLCIHLGMSGRLLVDAPDHPRPAHTHVEFVLSAGTCLRYVDARRFGSVTVVAGLPGGDDLGLGPDALATPWSRAALRAAIGGSRRTIFDVLLDQRRIAGLGNIYVQEILHRAGVDPRAVAGRLRARGLDVIAARIHPVLRAAIARRGTTLRDYRDASGRRGGNAPHLSVYGGAGAPCRCGAILRGTKLSGRSVTFCPRCQRLGRPRRIAAR
ncbi:MAG: bifunctional DNA-formamidopyrimidine glycosylase/DNA-(apurinic or apyrimidinic site) lyase [Deltaproteobacteria bacterium]|nr:MAG: bifunctional DNA-formamidopyrimidine glycosylase/DNA-(apurinic or apyrimidinic site) lyase [Deltaproteobacteria bacterium]